MTSSSPTACRDPLVELLQTYEDLNSSIITELDSPPSALEFMRFVGQNRPFVVRGAAADWEAFKKWNVSFLKEALNGEKVNVAVTPFGNADSPTTNDHGQVVFAKPWEEEQEFAECVDFIIAQERDKESDSEAVFTEVRYCQTQNDNLRNEYSLLSTHIPQNPSFARLALQCAPEAINLWIGNSLSTTVLHKDNYENLYYQILGQKHFVLLPPICYPLVQEKELKSATYIKQEDGSLKLIPENTEDLVPFATWDPDTSTSSPNTKYLFTLMRVTLSPGDMLYLPTMWYHKVSQSTCPVEGICCAVNYWYDMSFEGSMFPLLNMVRSMVLNEKEEDEKSGGERVVKEG